MPLHSTARLVQDGLLEAQAAGVIDRLREHNPLLLDFVLKRTLRWMGMALDRRVRDDGTSRQRRVPGRFDWSAESLKCTRGTRETGCDARRKAQRYP